jgi:hypothetical protein
MGTRDGECTGDQRHDHRIVARNKKTEADEDDRQPRDAAEVDADLAAACASFLGNKICDWR